MKSAFLPVLIALSLQGCIEDRLDVDITTRILPDGTTLRRTEYRLVRVDTDKGDLPQALPAAEDPLRLLHRFPQGELWTVHDQPEEKAHTVTIEGSLPSPGDLDWDYWRLAAPGSPMVARNHVSFAMKGDGPGAAYEYQEVFVDPASPAATARRVVELLARQEEEFAKSIRRSLGKGAPRASDLRQFYRDRVVAPTRAAVFRLIDRPVFGPGERKALYDLVEKGSTDELVRSLAAISPGLPESEWEQAAETAFGALVESIAAQLKREGLPVPDEARGAEEAIPRIHFRVTLVMPARITRANACIQGDTATWEFDRDDLYGRGFEMWAKAAAED